MLTLVGKEVARVHAVQAMEQGIECNLEMKNINFWLFGLVGVIPSSQSSEAFKDFIEYGALQIWDDGDKVSQDKQSIDQDHNTTISLEYFDQIPHNIVWTDFVKPLGLFPDQESHENKWRESTITGTKRFWQLVKQVLRMCLPETKKDLHWPQRAFGHAVIEETLNKPCFFGGVEVIMNKTFDIFHHWQLIAFQKIEEISWIQMHVWIFHFPKQKDNIYKENLSVKHDRVYIE